MNELRFDGRVVVVTGAGAGLGKAYALLFASRGAKVVVNDLGGGRHGDGKSSKAADDVVNEIKKNGGTAVADYNSVVEGDKIIKTALDNFGRIDVLINNAGILRDKSFARISDQDWNLIHDVHLKGSFKTTQAAFPVFKKQNYGRIIMTTSNSGLYGNFGQANYSAAKLGVVGLSNTVAIEGAKNNIYCNCITPTAASRLTEDILPPDVLAELKPELIAPVVAYLCHESCQETGSVIEAAAGWAGKVQLVRSNGSLLRTNITEGVTMETVRDKWGKITDMTGAEHLSRIGDATVALMTSLEGLRTGGNQETKSDNISSYNYTDKDLILYALGVGSSLSRPGELKFLYENHNEFSALPTFFILPSIMSLVDSNMFLGNLIPGKELSLMNLLHGEHYLEVIGDLKTTSNKLKTKSYVEEILDKGSGAAVVSATEIFNADGQLLARNQVVSFFVGAGNFGGPRTGTKLMKGIVRPSRAADLEVEEKIGVDQAALYRLSGDKNPLHIDSSFAALAGYKTPILHGLCTLGFSVRIILGAYAGYDVSLFKALKVRFVKPVYPGQTLKVSMWREGNRILFETSTVETNTVVISGGYVDLKSVTVLKPTQKNIQTDMALQSDAIFNFIQDRVKADTAKAKSIGGLFVYNITKDGKQAKQWTMDLKNANVYEGAPSDEVKPNATLTISDQDFVDLSAGKLNPQNAFMTGKLKVTGNIMMVQKLAPLLKAEAKL